MLHGVLPLSGALVAIGFSDLLRYIRSATHEIRVFDCCHGFIWDSLRAQWYFTLICIVTCKKSFIA